MNEYEVITKGGDYTVHADEVDWLSSPSLVFKQGDKTVAVFMKTEIMGWRKVNG